MTIARQAPSYRADLRRSRPGELAWSSGWSLTLTDLSTEMLELSRTINPDAEHVVGDMRTQWVTDPDPSDTTYQVDYALLLREADGAGEVRHDRHMEGLFPRQTWLDLLAEVSFEPSSVDDPEGRIMFVARRPRD